MSSWCPQCGPNVEVDEDGCCAGCGATAMGPGADGAHKIKRALEGLVGASTREELESIKAGVRSLHGVHERIDALNAIRALQDLLSSATTQNGGDNLVVTEKDWGLGM